MTTQTETTPDDQPQGYQRFDTEAQFQAAIERLLRQEGRELRVFDSTLSALKLNSPERIELFRAFLAGSRNRRIYMVAHNTDHVAYHCPRMMNLLSLYSHAVQINRTEAEIRHLEDSFLVLDRNHYVRRPVGRFYRGAAGFHDEAEGLSMRSRFQEIWTASSPAVSSSTSGL